MGLDSVELVMEWENAFAIQIPDIEAANIATVSDATDTILQLIQLQPATACKTQKLFYQFRQYFVENLGVDRENIQLTTQLSELLPSENRKKIWQHMEQSLGWTLPGLSSEDLYQNTSHLPILEVKILGTILVTRTLEMPLMNRTIGDLIGYVFALNYEKLVALLAIESRYEVEKVVMGITSDKIGVAIKDIKPESSFTSDLGID